jgi:hypothetical protein
MLRKDICRCLIAVRSKMLQRILRKNLISEENIKVTEKPFGGNLIWKERILV